MKPSALRPLALLALCLLASVARAVTATGLSSFEGIEEPLVKFFPATGRFEPDSFVNIIDLGEGAFRMLTRFNPDWWDGDRDTTNKDRQRAEVKGLGPRQKHEETFEYATTWRSSAGFHDPQKFCHIFQLKGIDGDNGAPVITMSLNAGGRINVRYWPGDGKPNVTAREFTWKPDHWQSVRIRVRMSKAAEGELLVSVDGDEFKGVRGLVMARTGSTEYRPKWGLYRGAAKGLPMGDDYVEHKNVTATRPDKVAIDNATWEKEARALARTAGSAQAVAWLNTQPASPGRDFAQASLAAFWAESDPAAAMAWVETQPPGTLRADALERVFGRWADADVTSALAWLQTHASRAETDPIAWVFVTDTTYRYVKRDLALTAVPLIKDPELRARAYEHVLEIWARTDADAAAAFLERSAALAPAQKTAIAARLRTKFTARAD